MMKTTFNLSKFAKSCGVTIIACGTEWGGKFGYKSHPNDNVSICGFRTESAAIKHWFNSHFGNDVGMKLLKELGVRVVK